MRRRDLFSGLLLATMPWRAWAQQPEPAPGRMPRIAIVITSSPVGTISETGYPVWRVFFGEMRRLGHVEGQNLVVERYTAEGRIERYPELAREVVGTKPDLILVFTTTLAQAVQAATTTIPIVGVTADPIALGLVNSLARPGGNLTGVSADAGVEIASKLPEFLKEAVPAASRAGVLAPRAEIPHAVPYVVTVLEAARRVGFSILDAALLDSPVQEPAYRHAFAALTQERADALIVVAWPGHYPYRRLIIELAAAARLPTIYPGRDYVELGGLLCYGADGRDLIQHVATQVDQILRGVPPGEIPFYQASKFQLVINLKTALGIEIPPSLLARADEVID